MSLLVSQQHRSIAYLHMEHSAEIAEVGIYSGLQKNWTFGSLRCKMGVLLMGDYLP